MANEFQDIVDQLDRLDGEEMRQIQRRALRRVGEIVSKVVQFECPVKTDAGGLLEPEELRNSFKAKMHIASDDEIATGKSSRVTIGPDSEVAKTVERFVVDGHYGPRPKGLPQSQRAKHDAETGNKWIAANPFVDKAFDECQEAAQDAYMESVTEDVNKVLP